MATRKLYWEDPHLFSFETNSARLATWDGKPAIVLEETAFYAEGGGQLGDQGQLRAGETSLRVVDTQSDDEQTIFHVLERAPDGPLEGPIFGSIDVARRRDMMAHHTAQHMLSRALLDVADAPTVSARLGASSCTLDLDKPELAFADLIAAEDLVNAVIRDDVEVRSFFPNEKELASLSLRRAPKVQTGVRVVEVAGFDFTPCGGTHVTRTGQIGVMRIVGTERYKGKTRALFAAATRALEDARAKEKVLRELSREMTCGLYDVGAGVAKLRAELKERIDALARARGELALSLATELLARHPKADAGDTVVRVLREGDDVASLRTLAGRLTQREDVVAICASREGGELAVVVQRGAGATFDCGAWLKSAAARLGGRGGGRPERAEGRLPAAFANELLEVTPQ